MKESVEIRYVNKDLQIGLIDPKHAFRLSPALVELKAEVYRGKLVYRERGSTKRVSYESVKKGLVKKKVLISREVPDWLYPEGAKRKRRLG